MLVSLQPSLLIVYSIIINLFVARSATAFPQRYRKLAFTTLRGGSLSAQHPIMTTTATTTTTAKPPIAHRDEEAVYYAGAAPPGWDLQKYPRQGMNSKETLLDPPVAIPNPYGWMRDDKRDKEQVQQHLRAENEYTQAVTQHLDSLKEELYQEMLSSIQETDYTTPRPDGPYCYYTRTFQGKSYTVHCRAPRPVQETLWDGQAETPILPGEQVVLDVNVLAEGKPYCSTGTVKHSPSHKLLAYAADFSGNEICQLFVKDLETGEIVHEDEALEIYGSLRWGADDNTIFFLKMDENQRPFQLYRRKLDASQPDELLFEEKDELYWMGCYKSLDGKYLFVQVESKETAEVHYLDLQDESSSLQCVAKRRSKVLYEVEHRNGQWWIQSNVGNLPNMALFTAPAVANCEADWKLVSVKDAGGSTKTAFDGGYDRSLDSVTCFKKHVVTYGREGGLPRIWILSLPADDSTTSSDQVVAEKMETLQFTEDAYDVSMGFHAEFDTDRMVAEYDSLVTPSQSLEISMDDTTQRRVIKERVVPGYDKSQYGCERTTVTSRDGVTQIPVSIVYRQDVMDQAKNNGTPVNVHLYGYGSYGSSVEADFRATRLALLNRGVVYVIAHIRGGAEMGRQWYEEPNGAKYLCKKNTFNDFVDVGRWLVEGRKLTAPDRLSCEGRSAGGMLIGASINQAPELFRAAILGVPFVDVCCTMVDASIPLTIVEWEEWGNPSEEKFHKYMMEYSPMENVQKGKKYPACLLTCGLHDPRVQFWEPAKFAATLRHLQSPDSGPVCLKTDMSAGHFSASDRYKYLRELAFDYAFLLDQVGLYTPKEG